MPIHTLHKTNLQIPDLDRVGAPVSAGKMSLVSVKTVDFRIDYCPSEAHSNGGVL
jgi:hypothetical protein